MRKIRIPGFESADGGICPYCGLEMTLHNKLIMEEKGHEIACLFLLKAIIKELTESQEALRKEIESLKTTSITLDKLREFQDAINPYPPNMVPNYPRGLLEPLSSPFRQRNDWERDGTGYYIKSTGISWNNVLNNSTWGVKSE